jgi:hypothetical protein
VIQLRHRKDAGQRQDVKNQGQQSQAGPRPVRGTQSARNAATVARWKSLDELAPSTRGAPKIRVRDCCTAALQVNSHNGLYAGQTSTAKTVAEIAYLISDRAQYSLVFLKTAAHARADICRIIFTVAP